ncbi:MAG TPA: TonB-dependent receptor [Rhodanobacteraceae bacterium]|nr:TonB-dependent receptor [Rhodanobacteraceae bacterium]
MNSKRYLTRRALPKRNALVVALALGMGISGLAYGQATSGTIFGNAPAGDTVQVVSNSGATRTVTVGANGSYTITNLPLGTYTVTLMENGQTVSSRNNVQIRVGGGVAVSFAGQQNAQNLAAVQVTANTLPAIDVSSVSSSTVITAQQLSKLPVGQSAESIALLSPGVISGSPKYNGAISFGGAGQTENAYYVNGFNTTEPFNNEGGSGLPYGVIAQQQTYTGGYSAKYGRSDGGVISQVGKSGTNEWHYGAQISWIPAGLRGTYKSQYYPVLDNLPPGYAPLQPQLQGKMRWYGGGQSSWDTKYSAYVGGPLVKDKLFVFLAAEVTQGKTTATPNRGGYINHYSNHGHNIYAKINWNINDNNILEYTRWSYSNDSGKGAQYEYDYDTFTEGAYHSTNAVSRHQADYDIFKYTSYLSDEATLSVLYGRGKYSDPIRYAKMSNLPYISAGPGDQNPAYLNPGEVIRRNAQSLTSIISPNRGSATRGLRVDFTYQLGDHKLGVGIDNMWFYGVDQGGLTSGPGYFWSYSIQSTTDPISDGLGVGIPSSKYVVDQQVYNVASSMSMYQKAWYVQDEWQVTPNFLLSIGVRNDRFVNNNDAGVAFVDEKNQWEPRIGFSWDIMGDSSMKLYGHIGRYYLALPNSMAERSVNVSQFTDQYFTYTGIDKNGEPTGLTPVPGWNSATGTNTTTPSGPVSSNNELGQAKDPNTVTAKGLKAMYQDEFILGFEQKLGEDYVWGVEGMYRKLGRSIDDRCFLADPSKNVIAKKLASMGLDPSNYGIQDPGCRTFNPGETNTYWVVNNVDQSYQAVTITPEDAGYGSAPGRSGMKPKRDYYSLNLHIGHPFDGKWSARIDYTFSKLWGNTEGQTRSDVGQTDVSKTMDWDFPSLMWGSNGYLSNQRRHVFKARGSYQITPEWLISGTLLVSSGMPKACLGYANPNNPTGSSDPVGYAPFYRYCAGELAPRGSNGYWPWTKQLNLGIHYTPAFADHKLGINLDIHNVLNAQEPLNNAAYPIMEVAPGYVYQYWGMAGTRQSPRYVRLSVEYNY